MPVRQRGQVEAAWVLLETYPQAASISINADETRWLRHMGEAALADVPEPAEIAFVMPNKHDLPIDLIPFGLDHGGAVFLPADAPYGRIEAMIARCG